MKTRAFLIFCSVGLVPIALGYGAKPSVTLNALFGINVDTINLTHIMRAVMGLYFGMVVLWLWGAFRSSMTVPALVACAVYVTCLPFFASEEKPTLSKCFSKASHAFDPDGVIGSRPTPKTVQNQCLNIFHTENTIKQKH